RKITLPYCSLSCATLGHKRASSSVRSCVWMGSQLGRTSLADLGLVALGEGHDEVMDLGQPGSRLHLCVRGVGSAVHDVVFDGLIEEHLRKGNMLSSEHKCNAAPVLTWRYRILRNDADGLAQRSLPDPRDILVVHGD